MRCCSARSGGPHERLRPPAGGGTGRPRGRAGGGRARRPRRRALQAALAAEHAAVYGYGVAGAHLSGARQRAAAKDWQIHEASRDALAAMITALGAQPVAAAAAYRLPFPVHSGRAAVMLAAFLEDRVATAYLGVVALSEARLRMFGARALESAALRAAGWRGRALAFPGLETPAPGPSPAGPGASRPLPPRPPRGHPPRPRPPPARRHSPHRRPGPRAPDTGTWHARPGPSAPAGRPPQADRVSACSMVAAAASRLPSAPIRSAHGHQNHQLPSRPRET